jgi:hypothetical protein
MHSSKPKNPVLFYSAIAAFFIINFTVFYPGVMTYDSRTQLAEAISGSFTDQHPPIMAALWRMLLIFDSGPSPMLVFHLLLFWGAIAVFGAAVMEKHPRLAWLFPLLWLLPPVMGMTGVIWKDTGLATSWLMLSAILTFYTLKRATPTPAAVTCMVFLFFYGLSVRHNGVLGAFPLVVWAVWLFTKRRILLKSAMLLAGFYMASAGLIAAISSPSFIIQQLYLGDIGYISWREHQVQYPPYITENKDFSEDRLYKKYQSGEQVMFLPAEQVFYTYDEANIATLKSAWLSTVESSPWLYLQGRWARFNGILRLGYGAPFSPYSLQKDRLEGEGFFTHIANSGFSAAAAYLLALRGSLFNMPYLWALLAAGLLARQANRWCKHGLVEASAPIASLCFSSLCYLGGYFFIATGSDDLRLVYWSILAAAVALLLTLIERVGTEPK